MMQKHANKSKYLVQHDLQQQQEPFPKFQKFGEILYENSEILSQIVDETQLKKIQTPKFRGNIFHLDTLIKTETENLANRKVFNFGDDPATIDLQTYHNLTEIQAYLNAAAMKHKKIAEIFNIGKSFQKRDIIGIKIGHAKKGDAKKKSVLLHSLIHAREWITGAAILNMIHELLETDKYNELLDKVDFYIIPVFNVDGYEYTWATDRMWRKSLSGPYAEGAIGVDLNRNFGWKWNDSINQEELPSSDAYSGPKEFSEIEDRNLRNFARTLRPFSYWDFHSCSGDFFFPTGISSTSKYRKYLEVGQVFVNATSEAGDTGYKYCEPEKCMYAVTGDTMDYFYYQQKVPFSFATEIGTCLDGVFEVPESRIQALSDEILAGFFAVIQFLVA